VDELRGRLNRRRQRRRSAVAAVVAVVLIAGAGVVQIERSTTATRTANHPGTNHVQLASYYVEAGNVPTSTLVSVGLPGTVAIPTKVTPTISTVATNGVVSYVGAEYCPYCALQRWALLVALSKFGTFTNLDKRALSSSSDVYPHLESWSFVGATYTSSYLTFDPTELTSSIPNGRGGYQPLEKMSAAQRVAFVKDNPQGVLPFVDMGNHYVTLGSSSSPSVLEGLSLNTIGSDLQNPSSPVARAIDGSANYLIGAICSMIGDGAPPICSLPSTLSADRVLKTGVSPDGQVTNPNTAPVQPPTNAPLSVWKKWSEEMHQFDLTAAANYQPPKKSVCTALRISVNGQKLRKPLFGVPAGVTTWSLSISGACKPKRAT
jgi:hypothetical protein